MADLVSSLSPTLWDLLQRTRLRPDLALELFDDKLVPLLPPTEDPRAVALRRAATIKFYAGSEISFRTVFQSGREARVSIDEWEVALLPVRDAGQPVGLLAAVTRRAHEDETPEFVTPGPADAAARAWRDAIEGDLIAARRLRGQEQVAHRARALATFVGDLQQCTQESELLDALLQAIAVWHDVEPCAYTRDLAGNFDLRATLPGTDASSLPNTLEAAAVMTAAAGQKGTGWPILTPLGWRGKGTPLLVLVSSGSLEEWLIALTGPHDPDITSQLEPLLRGFSVGMERVRERDARRLRQELWDAIVAWSDPSDVSGLGRELLGIIGRNVEATHGLLTAGAEAETPAIAGALVPATAHPEHIVRDGYFTADSLSLAFPLGGSRSASLELRRADGRAFRAPHATALLAVRPLLGAWLAALREAREWHATFGTNDPGRVLRFSDSALPSAWT